MGISKMGCELTIMQEINLNTHYQNNHFLMIYVNKNVKYTQNKSPQNYPDTWCILKSQMLSRRKATSRIPTYNRRIYCIYHLSLPLHVHIGTSTQFRIYKTEITDYHKHFTISPNFPRISNAAITNQHHTLLKQLEDNHINRVSGNEPGREIFQARGLWN